MSPGTTAEETHTDPATYYFAMRQLPKVLANPGNTAQAYAEAWSCPEEAATAALTYLTAEGWLKATSTPQRHGRRTVWTIRYEPNNIQGALL